MPTPDVSVIIPVYNGAGTLARCLEACLAQTVTPVEIIVVDDGSTDETPRIAQGFPVHYVHQENRGPAAARNHGVQEARGAIVAFTDADCIPEPDWLETLLASFGPGVVAVGGTYGIANPQTLLARMIHAEIVARHGRFGEEVDFLGSFNVAYLRAAYEAVGGFDEDFATASGEDNDLAYRLADKGGVLKFAWQSRVAHVHPERLGRYLRSQQRHGFWRMKLYAKHLGRSRGDRYSGGIEFAGPPLALAGLVALGAMIVPGVRAGAAVALAVAVGVLLVMRVPMAVRLIGLMCDTGMAAYPAMALVRDVARGIGMVRGLWTFMVCRRKTA